MKRSLLFYFLTATTVLMSLNLSAKQTLTFNDFLVTEEIGDTIVGFNFSDTTITNFAPNVGISGNMGYTLRAEDTAGRIRPLTYTNGASDYAATASEWDNGADDKFWSLRFKADGYENFVLYSKQRSGGANSGPKNWKVQTRISGGDWIDVPNGTLTVGNDWTTGVVNALPLPEYLNNPGTSSVFVRWIMTDNEDLNGNPVVLEGISKIDDIFILGTPIVIEQEGDTITGWDFSNDADPDFKANLGLESNHGYNIRAENTAGTVRPLTYTNGATDFAATATDWDNGANDKFWSIRFKAEGYTDFKLYSKQRSGGTNSGPKNWKIQTRISGGEWIDVPNGTVTVGNDWNTGVVNGLELPDYLNNPGSSSIFVRWIMTDNNDLNDNPVVAEGVSKIDDIIITAVNTSGNEIIIYNNNLSIYPNPCNNFLNIVSSEDIERVQIYNITGQLIFDSIYNSFSSSIDVSSYNAGLHLVRIYYKNEAKPEIRKIFIQ